MSETENYVFPVVSKKDNILPFLLFSVGNCREKSILRPNGLKHHQLLFSVKGCGEAVIDGKKVKITENSVMYSEPNTPHEYYPVTDTWQTAWVTFEQKVPLICAKNGVYQLENNKEFISFCNRLIAIEQNIYFEEKATVILYEMLLKIKDIFNTDGGADKLAPAISYIDKNFRYDISLEDLSGICSVTREYFCRLFKKSYNTTVFAYIKNLRIQEAKKMLISNKNSSLAEVAENAGYNSLNYFVTDFKKIVGITPSEFKKVN